MDYRQASCDLFFVMFLFCVVSGLKINDDEDYFDEPSFNRCPWIRNKLKNGRVRYRYKGRVAKFLCDSGFELAGKRSSTCVRGQWSNPIPVCVARGCNRVNSIANGRITEMYRGALLVYDCNPGYILDGSQTIHCDGRRWNASPPVCVIATEKPETYCDFENPDLCGWSQDPNHDFDWQRNQFSTPSGHVGTGPAFDHTFGENKGGFYLFIEASSPRKINDTARLFSPVFPPDLSGGCFIFWYHMYGATTGRLRVYLKPESHVFDELRPNWEKRGDQGNQWLKGHMIVPVLHENFQIVIEGVRGESYVGDSAVDDVRLTTNLCDSDDNSTDTTETTDQYSCRGRCQESGSESSCGCNSNCVDEPNFCCRDYYTICTIGNSTTIENTDEPLPEDYTTPRLATTRSTSYTTLKHSDEEVVSVSSLQTEKSSSTGGTSFVSSSTLTPSPTSVKTDLSTIKPISTTTEIHSEETSKESQTTMEPTKAINQSSSSTTSSTKQPSSPSSTIVETSTAPTTMKTTQYVSTDTSTSTTSTTPSTTSLKTTISSTTTEATTTTLQTTTPTTKHTTTSEITSTSSTQSTTLELTTESTSIPVTVSTTTTAISRVSSLATEMYTSSFSAATTSTTEPTILSTTTMSSTRKTYNLRPRNRTTSTTPYTTSPVSSTLRTLSTTASSLNSVVTTTTQPTSWFRYSASVSKQKITQPLVKSTASTQLPTTSTTSETVSQTKLPNRFTRPSKTSLTKTSDFYESKAKTASSNSSVPVVVSIIIIALICIAAGFGYYYFRKQRSKRQSKLSDDSEMRFLPESDFMDYSDSSALDRILVK